MIRLSFSVDLHYQIDTPTADFIFITQAAHTRYQRVFNESLLISQNVVPKVHTDPVTHTRLLRLQAGSGPLHLTYAATVDITHQVLPTACLAEMPIAAIPSPVLPYLYPSRYCESDRLHALAVGQFGLMPQGYQRVLAIRDWVRQRVQFRSNTSTSTTTACDTLSSGQGVCRDFAHLMIALCRAVNIPARFVTGFDYGADPILGPPDFHAYVEVYLSGRWFLFDPSGTAIPMGFVRIATSRDAADAAFATIFGAVRADPPVVRVLVAPDERGQMVWPQHCVDALSTDGEEDSAGV